jgi:hypothetical protein
MNRLKIYSFLFTMFLITSCSKEGSETGEVPYVPCPCEEEKELASFSIPTGEAYLFKDSIPQQIWFQINIKISESNEVVKWIIFDTKTNRAVLQVGKTDTLLRKVCEICNYPDFAKEWDIPINGRKVYFEGITYQACNPAGFADAVYLDYVLTNFKLK